MEVKVCHDTIGKTLTVWFGDPKAEHVCDEVGEEIILMKNREGRVIGFEKLNFAVPPKEMLRFAFETSKS